MSVGSWTNSVRSFLSPAAGLVRRIPGRVWLAAGLLLVAAFWLHLHDASIRRQAELQQIERQAAAQVSVLKKQAARDIAKANVENAEAIQKLEARRLQMEQQNRHLVAQLAALQKQEQIQVGQVATLPISEIATRVATQLGFDSEDVVMSSSMQLTPHPAAGASTLSPGRGPGHASSADIAKNVVCAPPAARKTAASRKGAKAQRITAADGSHGTGVGAVGLSTRTNPRHETDAVATEATAMALTASGARKVEAALVKLNACVAQSNVQSQQESNCQARAAADDATIQRQDNSISSLNQALQAKDRILNQQESEYKAELRAVRGTFWGRAARTAKHVAIGVAVGVAIGVAAR